MNITFKRNELNLILKETLGKDLNIKIDKLDNEIVYLKVANIVILLTVKIGGGKGQIVYIDIKLNNSVLQLGSFIAGLGGKSVVDYIVKNSNGLLEKQSRSKVSLNLLKISHRFNLNMNFKVKKITIQENELKADLKLAPLSI